MVNPLSFISEQNGQPADGAVCPGAYPGVIYPAKSNNISGKKPVQEKAFSWYLPDSIIWFDWSSKNHSPIIFYHRFRDLPTADSIIYGQDLNVFRIS
jgi:hypothetical protein